MIAPPPVAATPGATVSFELAPPPPPPPNHRSECAGQAAGGARRPAPRPRRDAARPAADAGHADAHARGRPPLRAGCRRRGHPERCCAWLRGSTTTAAAAATARGIDRAAAAAPSARPRSCCRATTPGRQLVATAPDARSSPRPDPLPAHGIASGTREHSIKTQWRGVTARGLKVHGENGEGSPWAGVRRSLFCSMAKTARGAELASHSHHG